MKTGHHKYTYTDMQGCLEGINSLPNNPWFLKP